MHGEILVRMYRTITVGAWVPDGHVLAEYVAQLQHIEPPVLEEATERLMREWGRQRGVPNLANVLEAVRERARQGKPASIEVSREGETGRGVDPAKYKPVDALPGQVCPCGAPADFAQMADTRKPSCYGCVCRWLERERARQTRLSVAAWQVLKQIPHGYQPNPAEVELCASAKLTEELNARLRDAGRISSRQDERRGGRR